MLDEYRTWLASELALLGNASHHAYAFGQANMAKRAIERLDEIVANGTVLLLNPIEVAALREALESRSAGGADADAALRAIHERLGAEGAEAEKP